MLDQIFAVLIFHAYDNERLISSSIVHLPFKWIDKPKTVGEACLIKMLSIIAFCLNDSDSMKQNFVRVCINYKIVGETLDLIMLFRDQMKPKLASQFDQKDNESFSLGLGKQLCKLDCCLSILYLIFVENAIDELEFLGFTISKNLIIICAFIENLNYTKRVDHIVLCLKILRSVSMKTVNLKKFFLSSGGFKLLHSCLLSVDQKLVLESLHILLSLVTNKVNKLNLTSTSIETPIVEMLMKFNFEKLVVELKNVSDIVFKDYLESK